MIKNEKEYWLVDQVKVEGKSIEDYKEAFTRYYESLRRGTSWLLVFTNG